MTKVLQAISGVVLLPGGDSGNAPRKERQFGRGEASCANAGWKIQCEFSIDFINCIFSHMRVYIASGRARGNNIVAMIPPYVTVIAEMTARPGKEDELKQHLFALVESTRREEGCVQYDLHVSHDDPRKFVFVENWTTSDALLRHSQSAHMQAFQRASAELRSAPAVSTYTRIA